MATLDQNKQAALDANLALLGAGWEDITLPPEYATFPTGDYLMLCQGLRYDEDAHAIVGSFGLAETIEADTAMGIPSPATNSLFYARFNLAASKGNPVGEFRKVFGDVAIALGAASPNEFLEQSKDLELVVSVVARRDKEDTTKIWNNARKAYTLSQYEELVAQSNDASM